MGGVVEDLDHLKRVYSSLKEFSVNLSYNLYSTYTSLKPFSVDDGKFIKKNDNEYLKLASIETFNTPNYRLVIDNDIKTMLLAPPEAIKTIPMSFDIAIASCEKIIPLNFDDNNRGYQFNFKKALDSEIISMTLIFNKRTFYLSRVVVFYKNVALNDPNVSSDPRLEIVYSDMSINLLIAQNYFDINRFVSYKSKEPTPINEYTNYSLYNAL